MNTAPAARGRAPSVALLLVAAFAVATGGASAQSAANEPATRTLELQLNRSQLSGTQPDGRAAMLSGTWALADGQVARAELLEETKFGARGGVVAGSYTRVFGPDWYGMATLAFGHGGPNWARERIDLDIAAKWGPTRSIVTHAAVYVATFDAERRDRGLRATVVAYLPASFVVEGGVTLNTSQPGSVRSQMPFVSLNWGRPGEQYLSLRASRGTEAYQALGAGRQLVDFHSRSVGVAWRQWLGPRWGFIASAEAYRNPSYSRDTLGAGLLVQF